MTPAEFIREKGGPAELTRAINAKIADPAKQLGSGAISLWINRNKIPRSSWPEIIEAHPDVTLDQLKAVEAAGEAAAKSPDAGAQASAA